MWWQYPECDYLRSNRGKTRSYTQNKAINRAHNAHNRHKKNKAARKARRIHRKAA